eukprot:357886-Chlamydomonas_euryale.AAC.2
MTVTGDGCSHAFAASPSPPANVLTSPSRWCVQCAVRHARLPGHAWLRVSRTHGATTTGRMSMHAQGPVQKAPMQSDPSVLPLLQRLAGGRPLGTQRLQPSWQTL